MQKRAKTDPKPVGLLKIEQKSRNGRKPGLPKKDSRKKKKGSQVWAWGSVQHLRQLRTRFSKKKKSKEKLDRPSLTKGPIIKDGTSIAWVTVKNGRWEISGTPQLPKKSSQEKKESEIGAKFQTTPKRG